MTETKTRTEIVAEALGKLTYREMIDLGQSLVDAACAAGGSLFDVEDAEGWAALLAAWAENNTPPATQGGSDA